MIINYSINYSTTVQLISKYLKKVLKVLSLLINTSHVTYLTDG